MTLHPLPVQLKQAGSNTVGLSKVESISYRAQGLLHLSGWGLVLEWTNTKTTQRVSMMGEVATEVEELPLQTVEIPFEEIASVRRLGAWWRPQIEIRVKGLSVLQGVPGVTGVALQLGIERRDRSLARAYTIEINERASAAELGPPDDPTFESGNPEPT